MEIENRYNKINTEVNEGLQKLAGERTRNLNCVQDSQKEGKNGNKMDQSWVKAIDISWWHLI